VSRSRGDLDVLREKIATIVKGQRNNNLLVSNSAMVLRAGGFHKRGAKQATNNLLSVLTAVYQTPNSAFAGKRTWKRVMSNPILLAVSLRKRTSRNPVLVTGNSHQPNGRACSQRAIWLPSFHAALRSAPSGTVSVSR